MTVGVGKSMGAVFRVYGMERFGVVQDVATLRGWLLKQPHLPHLDQHSGPQLDIDTWLESFLVMMKGNAVRAQHQLECYFSIKAASTVFDYLDPLSPQMQANFDYVSLALMPGLTPDATRLLVYRVENPITEGYQFEMDLKRCMMMLELILQEGVDFAGIHLVIDMERYRVGHMASYTLALLRGMHLLAKAYPVRVPRITLVNTANFMDKAISVFKPFVSSKLSNRIKSCKDPAGLQELVSTELLPKDYGGDGPSVKECSNAWKEKLVAKREYLSDVNALRADESRRIGKNPYAQTDLGINGSFRQLSVD